MSKKEKINFEVEISSTNYDIFTRKVTENVSAYFEFDKELLATMWSWIGVAITSDKDSAKQLITSRVTNILADIVTGGNEVPLMRDDVKDLVSLLDYQLNELKDSITAEIVNPKDRDVQEYLIDLKLFKLQLKEWLFEVAVES